MNIQKTLQRASHNISKFFLGNSIGSPGFISWFSPSNWSKTDLLNQYRRYVYTIVSSIAENCAGLEPEMYQRIGQGDKQIFDHELLTLLRKPNPMESQFQFLERHFTYMDLIGESFWYIARGVRTGKPKELYLLRPDLVDVVLDKQDPRGLVKGYLLSKGNGEKTAFDKEEILHFKYPNPLNPYRGMGAIEAAQMYIQTEEFASDWTKNSIYNAGRPSGILGIKGTIDEDQWEKVKRTFKDEYSGTKNAGKTMLFKDVDGLHYQRLGMELGDIALPEIKNLTRDDIMIMFRVSKTMLGITDDVNRANARESKSVFIEYVIRPKVDRFMDHINAFLVEPVWGDKVYLSYKDMTSINEKDKIEEYDKGLNKWLTINDIRKERGDKPLKGGDYIYMPITMVATVGDIPVEEPTEPEQPEEPSTPPAPVEEPEEEPVEESVKENEEETTKVIRIGQGQGEIFRQLLYRNVNVWARKYKTILRKELNSQLEQILENNTGKGIRKKDLDDWIPDIIAFKTKLRGILIPFGIDLFKEQSSIAGELVGMEEPIELGESIRKYITDRTDKMLDTLNKNIVDDLSSTIQEGIVNGDSLTDLKKRVRKVYKNIEDTKAELISRTETIAMSNQSALESYRQSKVVTKQEWRANPGACEFCEELNGNTVGLYESYALQGTQVQAGDRFFNVDYENVDHPPLHPNCFLHHTVKITTDKGEKNIGDIKVGDMVLTHKGRYRKVLRVLEDKTRYKGDAVRVTFRGKGKEKNHRSLLRNSFTVTPEHPFLTQRGWILAKDLTTEDQLFVKAKECENCGELVPEWKDYCCMKCQLVNEDVRKKISESKKGEKNYMFNRTGVLHHLWQGGKVWWRGKDWDTIKLKARERDGFECQECGLTEEEHMEKYKQPLQVHHINPYRKSKDNSLENLVTVCCVCHRKLENTCQPQILLSGGARFVSTPVIKTEALKDFQGERLYNFSVEEDESYVAKGVVSHNCECTILPVIEE